MNKDQFAQILVILHFSPTEKDYYTKWLAKLSSTTDFSTIAESDLTDGTTQINCSRMLVFTGNEGEEASTVMNKVGLLFSKDWSHEAKHDNVEIRIMEDQKYVVRQKSQVASVDRNDQPFV